MPAESSSSRQNPVAGEPPDAGAAKTLTATERQALDAALRESEAARTALAAANAELQRATAALAERTAVAERAVARTERLQALTAALAGAQTLDDVAGIVVSQVAAATKARTAMLALRTGETDDARVIGQTGLTAHVRPPRGHFSISTTPGPASVVLRTGEPLWVTGEAGDALLARFPESAPVWTSLQVAALATVPLTVGGAAVGVISFTFTEPRAFTPEDRAFFLALGRQAAQAVERARLLEAESAARAAADAARAAAEAANQVKTDFLATMSHELRTPLNAIAGYAELLDLGIHGPVTDQQREAISRIQRSQRHLAGLINDVLNFAKLEAGRVEYHLTDIPVHAALDALEPLVMPQLHAKRLHYERAPCDQALAVRADAEKLQQILVNLLSNAIKFTAAGGTVTLSCDDGPGVVRLAVRDTGIGIPPGRLGDAFAPFVQVDRRLNAPHEGTGLGLAISRDLARGMGGDLTAVSEPGAGSTFSLTLPRA